MNELNSNEKTENTTEALNTPNLTDTPDTAEVSEVSKVPENKKPAAKAVRRGYQNATARILNCVFIVLLVFMAIFLALQLYLNIAAYLQQGAAIHIALLYTLAGVSTPFLLCSLPFFFKFFAEVVELLDKNK